jgi:hypothetical protein
MNWLGAPRTWAIIATMRCPVRCRIVEAGRRLAFVSVIAGSLGAAKPTPTPPPAAIPPTSKTDGDRPAKTAGPTVESEAALPDLMPDEAPGYVPNAKTDTPECRAAFDDFNQTWRRAGTCERDDDCTIALGTCSASRKDFKSTLEKKLAALAPCVAILALSACTDARAICFKKTCRVRGRPDKTDTPAPGRTKPTR